MASRVGGEAADADLAAQAADAGDRRRRSSPTHDVASPFVPIMPLRRQLVLRSHRSSAELSRPPAQPALGGGLPRAAFSRSCAFAFGCGFLLCSGRARRVHQPGGGAEACHPVARRRAVLRASAGCAPASRINRSRVVLRQHRVVGAQHLDEAAVARAARIGDDDAVERALLGAAARQTNSHAHAVGPFLFFSCAADLSSPWSSSFVVRLSAAAASRAAACRAAAAAAEQAALAHLADLLHHRRHLLMLLQQAVDVLHRRARAGGDAPAPRGVEELRVAPLGRRHRQDDRLLPGDHLVVDLGVVELLLDLADRRAAGRAAP